MSVGLTGLTEISNRFKSLGDQGAKKAAKAGVNASLASLAKEIRSRVNSLPISGELKRQIRQTVGKRLQKVGQDYVGKAGFAVGKQSAKKKEKAAARSARGQGGTQAQRGVGISAANVHWLMGTAERHTDSGHYTGRMPDELTSLIADACESAAEAMLTAMADKVKQVLAAEAAK
jgi:hypothetical protein